MVRWLVPITAIADWIDDLAEPAEVSGPPVGPARQSVASKQQQAGDTSRRGRLRNKVREAQCQARANHFMGEVLALLCCRRRPPLVFSALPLRAFATARSWKC